MKTAKVNKYIVLINKSKTGGSPLRICPFSPVGAFLERFVFGDAVALLLLLIWSPCGTLVTRFLFIVPLADGIVAAESTKQVYFAL